jgi:hypothetical protein
MPQAHPPVRQVAALFTAPLRAREMTGILRRPSALIFWTVFYVWRLFSFHDSFGGTQAQCGTP